MNEPEKITIDMTFARAKEWTDSLADIICWCRGFNAALGIHNRENGPLMSSVDALGDLNSRLKDEIHKARKAANE